MNASKTDVSFCTRPIQEIVIGPLQPDKRTGDLVIGDRFVGRFEELRDHRFAGCLVASRTMDLVQKIEFGNGDSKEVWEFDQRKLCGWRTLGPEPILEIRNEMTDEKWWYVYRFHSSGEWLWCQLLPMLGGQPGYHFPVQFQRFLFLVFATAWTFGTYAVATLGFVALVVAVSQ